ncbi:hypothetical protein NQ315_007984 [Exocentrus adspersus]|uniref:DNA repair protein RAD50 n=1 Tax=Exocentrus adspersus TaxID=1586481 RepID=A0AAV8VFI0_9CUCU|nr:hypothetical protein NQ315_007984 [Exocentrus adspersus]
MSFLNCIIMALLHSLQIRGIRSFSPDNDETIYFNTPVTLFLGQNGCGKTTIIESIRFALTSEVPAGSNNGQGFLNDPKISSKSSTKGSIKIKFLDCQGNEITVSRFLMVTAKAAGGLTFKKIAVNVRRRDKDDLGNPKDISGRCLEIDNYCSGALNVSKSILNNVIFCHQENSAWPLDEPKRLKEKFDEIFDAVKYNKCVEILRKFIKERQGNLKKDLPLKKSIKDEVEKKRGKFNEKKDKLQGVENTIKQYQINSKPMEARMKEILDLEASIGALQRNLTAVETEKKGVIEQQNTIRKHISYIFKGSDEELRSKMETFHEEQEEEKNLVTELEKRNKEISEASSQLNENIQKKLYNEKLVEIKTLIDKAASNLKITVPTHGSDNELIISDLKNALNDWEEEFKHFIAQKDLEEKKLQNEIDEIREKHASTKQIISSKKCLIEECKKKITDINYKLDELDSSDSQLAIIADNIKKLETTLRNLKKSFNEDQILRDVDEMREQIQNKENYLQKLDKEFRILNHNYAKEQQLDIEKKFLIEKRSEISKIKSRHAQDFENLFGGNLPEKNIMRNVTDIQKQEELKFKTITNKVNELQKQVTTLETKVQDQQNRLASTFKELEAEKKKVSDLCSGRPFNDVLTENFNKREKLQRDKGQYSSAKIMYEAFVNKFEKESPCCPICNTDFTSKEANVKIIIQQLKNKIERIPMQLVHVEKELKTVEEMYNKLQQLKPVNDNIEILSNAKIPLMEEELINLTKALETSSRQLLSEKDSLTSPVNTLEICKSVITDVTLLDQHISDVEKTKNSISNLERDIVKVPSNRSRQETEAEIDSVKAELNNLKNQYETNKTMIESHRIRCQDLNTDIQRETQKQIDMQKLVQEKPLLESQKTELTEKLAVLRVEIEESNNSLNTLDLELAQSMERRQNTVLSNRKTREDKRNEISTIKNMITDINKLQNQINLYIKNNSGVKLEAAITELAELKTKEKKLEDARIKVVNAISTKKQNLAKQETDFRALKDNVILREKQKLEQKLEKEINDLKKQIGNYDIKSLYDEKQRLQRKIDNVQRDINSLSGQQEEIIKQLTEIEEELEKRQNKNAYNNYKKQYYELKVEEFAVQDLIKYVTVLERSVLQFHKERMVHINTIIRELWRSIYRGNDIDYIEIQTDEGTSGGAKRRTYNYKVVQVKKGVELEMRGRCSAGQKVLACLVIRMALAETFSAHCGILALDEPTTNLDRENIMSLSDSLSRIISTRENEKNFQLLIITHDEEFLNTLVRVQSIDNYWKVKRNEEGFSTVEKHLL